MMTACSSFSVICATGVVLCVTTRSSFGINEAQTRRNKPGSSRRTSSRTASPCSRHLAETDCRNALLNLLRWPLPRPAGHGLGPPGSQGFSAVVVVVASSVIEAKILVSNIKKNDRLRTAP